MKVVVTGGCGFIGHHFVDHVLMNTDWNIVVLDKLTYASHGLERLRDTRFGLDKYQNRVKVFTWDLAHPLSIGLTKEIGQDVDYIVHMAADTHIDNSIEQPTSVIENNVMSTVNMLEFARKLPRLKIFFNFGTDEVYGPALGDKMYVETDRHRPTNPYSASKSAAEGICHSYWNTYKIPLMTVNVMNAFGERQHCEKFIPLVINKVVNEEKVLIHSYPDRQRSGSRFYIHARNIASAVMFLLERGVVGETYNLTGEQEISNLDLAEMIAAIVGKPLKYEMTDHHSSRPGHDLRYGLDGSKMKELGWNLPVNFEDGLKNVVEWTLNHPRWLHDELNYDD